MGDKYGPNDGAEPADDNSDVAGKVFVGGLSWQTTVDGLRYYFEKYGQLADVALMNDKRSGQPRGFGFVTFKDPAAAEVVVSQEHSIDGRVVDCKRAMPKDKAPAPTRSEIGKIFVGGLSVDVTNEKFFEYFSKYGPVKDAIIMVDRATNRSRGFGFITFENEGSVNDVMRQDHELSGKAVEIKRAEPRTARGPGEMMNQGGGMGGNRGGRGGGMRSGDDGGYGGMPYGGMPYGGYGGYGGGRSSYGGAPMGMYGGGVYPPNMAGMGSRGGYGAGAYMMNGMGYSNYGGSGATGGYGQGGGYGGYGQSVGAGMASAGGASGASMYGQLGVRGTGAGGEDEVPSGGGASSYAQPLTGYGGGGGYANSSYQSAHPQSGGSHGGDGDSPNVGGGYGGYRSQGSAQGRAERSYRPY